MSVLALVALPAAAGIFAVAPFLVPVVLGTKWLESTALIEILAFNGALLLFQSSICSVVTSRGFPRQVAIANGLYVIVLIGLLTLLASRWGVIGAAWAVLMTAILMTPAYLYLMNRQLGVGPSVFLRATVRPVFAAIAMVAIVRWFLPAYTSIMSVTQTVGWLAAGIAIGIVVFIVCVALLWRLAGKPASAEGLVLDRARKLLARKGPV
jgi:lipopolysaccharide exporter